jgi:hypothetical protein
MDRKTKKWIIILAAVMIAGLVSYCIVKNTGGGTIAVISIDGEEYERIDLSKVTESYDIELSTQYGHNTIHVEPGAISVTAADCPDLVCVNQGRISQGGIPIACVPHRLVIQIEGGQLDG